ncbi:MAG: hypothetical protein K8Q89_07750 [Nitrosarchaeum sp.]|nr:hypothetical protein [Nitrosarchaeum sp.]
MAIPLKNLMHEKIKEMNSLTDIELYKAMTKDGMIIAEDRFNKLLLDLEILGLIKVAWITKEARRIEIVTIKEEIDIVDEQNQEMMEKDYEASFPGFEK